MGDRVGIIAGSGGIPRLIAGEARRRGLTPVVAAIRGEAESSSLGSDIGSVEWFSPGEIVSLLAFLGKNGVENIVIAGKINPAMPFLNLKMNADIAGLFSRPESHRPVPLIGALIGFLETRGLNVLDPIPFLGDCFPPPGILTRTAVFPEIESDIDFGIGVARRLADDDVGQTVVVKGRAVVAVEGLEGTDEAIARGGKLAGPGTTVVKVSRTNQDPRIDLPAAGPETIRSLGRARAAALCLEAGRVAFFDKDEAVALADELGIAVVAREIPVETGGKRSTVK